MLNKWGSPIELPSLYGGTRVQAESLLMKPSGKHRVKDLIGQFTDSDTDVEIRGRR